MKVRHILSIIKKNILDHYTKFNYYISENVSSKNDEVMQLKTLWQEKIVQFDRMKTELNDKQVFNDNNHGYI